MSLRDDIAESIFNTNGTIRRRFSAGIVAIIGIVFSLSFLVYPESILEMINSLTESLPGPFLLIIGLISPYIIGIVVDITSDLFVVPFIGNIAWAFDASHCWVRQKPMALRIFWGLVMAFIVLGYMVIGAIASLAGESYHRSTIESDLTEEARKKFTSLPKSVQVGLKDPFGKYGSLPWKFFNVSGSQEKLKKISRNMEIRNRFLLAVGTSLIFPVAFGIASLKFLPALSGDDVFHYGIVVAVGFLIVTFLFYSYYKLVMKSVSIIIECLVFQSSKDRFIISSRSDI